MKTLSTQLPHVLQNKEIRQNLSILLKYIGMLLAPAPILCVATPPSAWMP